MKKAMLFTASVLLIMCILFCGHYSRLVLHTDDTYDIVEENLRFYYGDDAKCQVKAFPVEEGYAVVFPSYWTESEINVVNSGTVNISCDIFSKSKSKSNYSGALLPG